MGTIHKSEAPVRELTKTEIDIAVAQIVDRLTRVIRFAEDINRANDLISDDDANDDYSGFARYDNPSAWASFAAKHDIPDGVHPMFNEALRIEEIKDVSAHIRKWVRGNLSRHDCELLVLYASEWNEYDFGWVFMESPGFNYSKKSDADLENRKRFVEIGSRNYKGNPEDCTIDLHFFGTHFKPTRATVGRPKGS